MMRETLPYLEPTDFPPLSRANLQTLQVNIGLECNQACLHCHTDSNPHRREKMDRALIELIIEVLDKRDIQTLDVTGGAPEMHPDFRWLVREARDVGVRVIDRCNLTILEQAGYEDMAAFLAEQQVEIIASLPCYSQENVDRQRGDGVFNDSIAALKKLNALGYGQKDGALKLSLIYNPQGARLPPSQGPLEAQYKKALFDHFGIVFDHLFTLSNMPIKRFGSMLVSQGQFDDYIQLLKSAHQDGNLENVMCRNLISVNWRGHLFDCDFNQMLGLRLSSAVRPQYHLQDLLTDDMANLPITVRDHCYGCTAGQGSSCGGALS